MGDLVDVRVINDKETALKIIRDAIKHTQPTPDEPVRLVDAGGSEYKKAAPPETLCFLLAEWLSGEALVPSDIASLPKSSTALRDHTRPDGGICLGRHVDEDNPWADVVIFGDPLMPIETVGKVAHVYREHLAKPKTQIVQ